VTGEATGTVQATVATEQGTAEVAWVIGVPWQGRGYASEATQAVVAWLESTGLGTIDAHIHPSHLASEVVATRAGLSPTDELVDGERVWRRARPGRGRGRRTRHLPATPGGGAR
jgi:RimJ/RimL family protein N-acetyltransferase